jgi:hypothetical protein
VARAARRLLVALDVDLAVSNQNHVAWRQALGAAGFLGGPSNYLIATSKALAQTLAAAGDAELLRVHLTRGDGDGRLQL